MPEGYQPVSAIISQCEQYRYQLTRELRIRPGEGNLPWVMLNPSTADDTNDDQTIRRLQWFTSRWGYNSLTVLNLYAYRATKPSQLWTTVNDPVGPVNDVYIYETLKTATDVMVAWGNHAKPERVEQFMNIVKFCDNVRLLCLDYNKSGSPKHPLYVKGDVLRKIWRP